MGIMVPKEIKIVIEEDTQQFVLTVMDRLENWFKNSIFYRGRV